MLEYNPKQIEPKWQKSWEDKELYRADDFSQKEKYYYLIEFPYPSAEGLHVGHPRSYTALDILARKKRMQGFNVLYPIGWDAFGLPAENYAIKTGTHPRVKTEENIQNFKRQLKALGYSFDWSREINTTDPQYYKWTQWIFLKLFEKNLAYKSKMDINWCVSCNVGLANEEVVDGKCERCGGEVVRKEREQWMLKITEYADRLLADLDKVDYWEKIKKQQIDWIGKSYGAQVVFKVKSSTMLKGEHMYDLPVYTTRPDTLFGATYMVVAPEHELIEKFKDQIDNYQEVKDYIEQTKHKSEQERTNLEKVKTGVELHGLKAINPVNEEAIPVFAADYVLTSYGTGAIMAVPAHDQRDYEFAHKYNLPVKEVIRPYLLGALAGCDKAIEKEFKKLEIAYFYHEESAVYYIEADLKLKQPIFQLIKKYINSNYYADLWINGTVYIISKSDIFDLHDKKQFKKAQGLVGAMEIPQEYADLKKIQKEWQEFIFDPIWDQVALLRAYEGDGFLVNSDFLNGLAVQKATDKICDWLKKQGLGFRTTNYHLRDWVFSRQRYWGEPIPIIICPKCGYVPVPENDLPVKLPEMENYRTTETGDSPLALAKDWLNVACPQCGSRAQRETDTMPQWAGSSWYFLRYIDPYNDQALADKDKLKYWTPVDWYNGGMEHTTLHLLYSRFWHKFLYDIDVVPTPEPYAKRTSHGFILGEDGEKMSKSRGNVINPDDVVREYGADTFRVYMMFMGPFEQATPWNTQGVLGVRRFIEKVWQIGNNLDNKKRGNDDDLVRLTHKTIQQVTEQTESLDLNTCISALMILINKYQEEGCNSENFELFLKIFAPFAPHLCEELWVSLGHQDSIFLETWPEYDKRLVKETVKELPVQINGKVRSKIFIAEDLDEAAVKEKVLADEKIKEWLEDKPIKKFIYVKDKIINIVI